MQVKEDDVPTISIWFQLPGQKPEVVDRASNLQEAEYLLGQYRLAFGPQAVLWAGRRDKRPESATTTKNSTVRLRSYRDVL